MPRQKQVKKTIIGVTGTFGSGKSTVAGLFKARGAKVIDADRLAHASLNRAGVCYKKIVNAFGAGILKKNKEIDRQRLACLVFGNKKLLRELNSIVHPEVIRRIKSEIRKARQGLIILDVPLLIESGLHKIVDKVILVDAKRERQIKRIQRKLHLKRSEISIRIKCQLSASSKARFAHFIIDNNGTKKETQRQAREVWKRIR